MWARPPIVGTARQSKFPYNTLRVGRGILESLFLGSRQISPLLAMKFQPGSYNSIPYVTLSCAAFVEKGAHVMVTGPLGVGPSLRIMKRMASSTEACD